MNLLRVVYCKASFVLSAKEKIFRPAPVTIELNVGRIYYLHH